MTKSRESKPCDARALLALVTLLGCGGAPAQAEAPSSSSIRPPRRPDGVVLDPAPALPLPSARAEARGVVALRQPPRDDAVLALVQSFVDAWQQGSLDALLALLAPEAGPIEGRVRGRGALVEGWRQRLQAHPYTRLAGAQLVRPDRVVRWDWEELGAPGAPPRPQEMRPGEIYLRAPLEVTRVTGEKLFDDVMVMLLRADGGKLAIVAYGEDDSP